MKGKITKEEIKNLIKIPGKVRGQVFLTDLGYIKEKEGEEGVKLLKKKMAEWGNPIDYDKAEVIEWYPLGLRVISLLAIKEVFNWEEKQVFDLGNAAPKFSFIVKMLIKIFSSIEKVFNEGPKYWQRHYTKGVLENYRIDLKKKYVILRLKDFKIHPILCPLFAGYFLGIAQYSIESKEITIKETKCSFKGDPYHEYLIKWK